MTDRVLSFFSASDKKILISVARRKDTDLIRDGLLADVRVVKALNGRRIVVANAGHKQDIGLWCTDPNIAILVGTSVVGAGVSNNDCDLVIQMLIAHHIDAMVQVANRSGRTTRIGAHFLIYVPAMMDSMCGQRGGTMRLTKNAIVSKAIGYVGPNSSNSVRRIATPDGVESYAANTTMCRMSFLAAT
jgi:superfamily II DNA/RNA helicase